MSDQLFDGRRIRLLTIDNAYTWLSPAVDVRARYRSVDVVDTLDRIKAEYGTPKSTRVDNCPEYISKELDF